MTVSSLAHILKHMQEDIYRNFKCCRKEIITHFATNSQRQQISDPLLRDLFVTRKSFYASKSRNQAITGKTEAATFLGSTSSGFLVFFL